MSDSARATDIVLKQSGPLDGYTRHSIPLRLGLIGTGLITFTTATQLWGQTGYFWQLGGFLASAATWLFSMICLLLAVLRRLPRRAQWLVLAGLVGSLWISAYLQWRTTTPSTTWHPDNEMIGEYAAQALSQGYNPYSWNFSDATRVYRDQGVLYTYFLDGSSQNRVTYPALPTLLLAALGSIGLGQARFVSLVFHSILLILIFVGTPERLRPLYVVGLFAVRDIMALALTGIQDIVWSTLLVAMLFAWKRPTLRAILFGLACAYRQQPWILAPFLLIYLWNTEAKGREGRLRIVQFAGVSLGVFLLINLPFILWDARGWALGVFEPTYAAFGVASQGLGALTQYDLLNLPRTFLTVVQLSLLALMLIVHWRHPRAVAVSFWMFPAIFFWPFYRGLTNYWLYWIPPLMVALTRHKWSGISQTESGPSWRRTSYVIAGTLIANVLLGVYFASRPPAITARLLAPIQSADNYTVTGLTVSVFNGSNKIFRPRFAVQHDGTVPLPWDIASGPAVLLPQEAADYIVGTYGHPFWIASGAQLVISDAGGDYSLRAVKNIDADLSFTSPDLIMNPSFSVWRPSGQMPAAWTWSPPEGQGGSMRSESVDGRTAVAISVASGTGRLSQTTTFPETFSIWVHPNAGGTDSHESAYGLELDDGQHKLWVLFGDSDAHGMFGQDIGYAYQRASLNQWSKQEINPAALYALLGWEVPPLSLRDAQGLEFWARQVKLSLLVSGSQVEGVFGPIEQDARFVSPEALVEDAIQHPDVYYVNRGEEYRRQRNDGLAESAYRRALTYNEGNPNAHYGLGLVLAETGRCVEAQEQIATAIQLSPGIRDPAGSIIQCQ